MSVNLEQELLTNERLSELLRILSRLDARLEQLDEDLNEIKNDNKFKQLLIVILLTSMLGINVAKSIAVKSIEGLIDDSVPTATPNRN